ncbi:unnamed protein product [Linum tenue]|uniref:Uncharacterized protein n=1 Tax=Linum tenue TaxID=586396 RepID=A0AAV0QZ50_9ROSI|nr:unnamed protein product [Linum tenue]
MLEMREHIGREKWIAIEKAKILRERLRWCYRVEGVNHHQKCRHLVEEYLESPCPLFFQLGTPSSSRGSGTTRRFGGFGFWLRRGELSAG